MSFLLDTNVVSEWVRAHPDPGVVGWLDEADEDRIFLSVITLAELRHGIERLRPGRRRTRLAQWLEDELPRRFEGRILTVDQQIADSWGRIVAHSQAIGHPVAPMDAFLAATAATHELTLVTRNVSDFAAVLRDIFNPWSA